jgi:hypothetical protein
MVRQDLVRTKNRLKHFYRSRGLGRLGEAVFDPPSRRPNNSPSALPAATVELIVGLRKQLAEQGLDAGADTIGWHLAHHHGLTVSRASINRYLRDAGLLVPQPRTPGAPPSASGRAAQRRGPTSPARSPDRRPSGADTEIWPG